MIVKHKHHIIPKHMKGTDDPSNIVELTVEQHAKAHKQLYEQYGNEYDRIAWLGLSGQIDKAEANRLLNIEQAKKSSQKRIVNGTHNFLWKNNPPAKKLYENGTHPFLGGAIQRQVAKQRVIDRTNPFLSGEIQRKTNKKRLANGTHTFLKINTEVYTCPHCKKTGKGYGPMSRWHFNNCKEG